MLAQADLDALATLAHGLPALDLECYRRHGRDPSQPMLGLGRRDARLCFVGRDPGDSEIAQWQPFVGASGQKIRAALAQHGDASVFWINTVPYKPLGNKAWPPAVRRRFHAVLFPLLLRRWDGRDVVTFGREAYDWFGLGPEPGVRERLAAFWEREDKFEANLELRFGDRTLVLHPLPHPSPANGLWKAKFPRLLEQRLRALLPGSPPARG